MNDLSLLLVLCMNKNLNLYFCSRASIFFLASFCKNCRESHDIVETYTWDFVQKYLWGFQQAWILDEFDDYQALKIIDH